MTEEIKQLLIDCANFIQPYDDGGNEAERLMIRLDEALKQGKALPIDSVSKRFTENQMDDAYDKGYEDGANTENEMH